MRNSRICPENYARFVNLMCENAHRAALTLSLVPPPPFSMAKTFSTPLFRRGKTCHLSHFVAPLPVMSDHSLSLNREWSVSI